MLIAYIAHPSMRALDIVDIFMYRIGLHFFLCSPLPSRNPDNTTQAIIAIFLNEKFRFLPVAYVMLLLSPEWLIRINTFLIVYRVGFLNNESDVF